MRLDISPDERDFLLELLEEKRTSLLHQIHHTDTHDYEDMLKRKVDVLEGLKARIEVLRSASVAG
jgi:hypothetical protein